MLWYALTWTASNLSSLCSRLAALSLSVLTSWFLISRTRWRLAASWLRVIFLKFVVFVYTVHYYYRRMTGPLGAVLWIPVTFWYAPLTNGSGSCYFRPWLSSRQHNTGSDPGGPKTTDPDPQHWLGVLSGTVWSDSVLGTFLSLFASLDDSKWVLNSIWNIFSLTWVCIWTWKA
jgi:hypothetical protein